MEKSIFDNAVFGDFFVTRSEEEVVYIKRLDNPKYPHQVATEWGDILLYSNDGKSHYYEGLGAEIVKKGRKQIQAKTNESDGKFDYDPYELFDAWANAVYDKLGLSITDTYPENTNSDGETFMVVNGIIQDCSLFFFFTEYLSHLGIYGKNGYKTMSVEDAIELITSSVGLIEVEPMFQKLHIRIR